MFSDFPWCTVKRSETQSSSVWMSALAQNVFFFLLLCMLQHAFCRLLGPFYCEKLSLNGLDPWADDSSVKIPSTGKHRKCTGHYQPIFGDWWTQKSRSEGGEGDLLLLFFLLRC